MILEMTLLPRQSMPIAILMSAAMLRGASPVEQKFVGSWKLISFVLTSSTGEVTHPLGQNAEGRITYDAAGRMSVQIMQPGRPNSANPQQIFGANSGYLAYYGSYVVEEARGVVVHRVEASLFPNYIGTNQVRRYSFSGNRLTLEAETPQLGRSKLIWERLP